MVINHLKLAFRNISKRKGYTILNIAGLTIGMTCCLLIFHHVSLERSYDTFEPAAKNIFRVRLDSYQKGKLAYKSATSYPAIAPGMKKDFAEVEDYCRLIDNELLLSNEENEKKFTERKGYYADPSVVKMFGINFLAGDPLTALDAPDKIILSESTAKKYFGNEAALNKTLVNRNSSTPETFKVTGVYKDFPANSHLILEYLVSYSTLGKEMQLRGDSSNASETAWGWYDFYVYIQLKDGQNVSNLQAKLPAFTDKYINSQEWNKTNNNRAELHLVPLSDIHLYSNVNQEAEVNGNGQAVAFLFLIAIFIICIAWINYINLATARSVERAKEVGVRKVLGALRNSLIRQFLTESIVLNFVSLVFSLIAFLLLLPAFDSFTGRENYSAITLTSTYWLLYLALFLTGTLLSGVYPAFVLSGFKPITVLKGVFKNSGSGLLLRKSLITIQFVTSVVLIAGTIIVYQQVNYMRNQKIGADINQTIVIKGPQTIKDSLYLSVFQPFKTAVLQINSVKAIAASSNVPGEEIYWTRGAKRLGADASSVTLYNLGVDYDFIPAYNMQMAAGRNFSEQFGKDESAVILNENAAALLGFKNAANAINEKIINGGDTVNIVGITTNFHQLGLQKNIDPMILRLYPDISSFYSVKIAAGKEKETIASIQKLWSNYFPKDPYDYFFLDEAYNQQYKADMLFGKVFVVFAFLAILIACFGLLGLSAYNVLQRTKEIGIRKVLGASVQNLLILLSKDFLKLVLISLVLAIPVGWFVMHQWLQDYAHRIEIGWWVFAIAGIMALFIAIVTICIQVLKTIVINPVKSLRSE
ncbi:MAG: ABC transporter permease [Bacteroidota bacterium]